MLKIWGRATSINVQKVMWIVGELGLAHERIDVGGAFGGLDTPEFLDLNPHGRIPVVEDGQNIVWESNACIRYLAAAHGGEPFWPTDPGARARADQWMDWQLTSFYGPFIAAFLGIVRTAPSRQDHQAISAAARSAGQQLGTLEGALDGRLFLGGDDLGLGDFPIGTMLYRYFTLEIERPSLPNVAAYYGRLTERDAYRSHVMVSYDALRVTD